MAINSKALRLVSRNPEPIPASIPDSGLKCAVYCRKSNDDDRNQTAANKSVQVQLDVIRAFASKKGWRIDEEFIFTDDGISGAEYELRPGLSRLIATLPKRGKAPFDCLLMTESSRLGRDMMRNSQWS
jgi:DNA invertase Pin-like site-specific DNA recombinase